jgi:hypothetical protein
MLVTGQQLQSKIISQLYNVIAITRNYIYIGLVFDLIQPTWMSFTN